MNVEKEDDEKEMASTEGNTNVEMTTNNDMNTDAAATEPPASTSTSTVENETHPAATATNLEAAPIEEEKMSSKDDDKQEEMKPTRSGCSCQGSCLVVCCLYCLLCVVLALRHRSSRNTLFPIFFVSILARALWRVTFATRPYVNAVLLPPLIRKWIGPLPAKTMTTRTM